jgi:hypothetical protein
MTLCGNGSLFESELACETKAMSSRAQSLHGAELANRLGQRLKIGKVDGAAKAIAACGEPATERAIDASVAAALRTSPLNLWNS